jgi:hypothetical protein
MDMVYLNIIVVIAVWISGSLFHSLLRKKERKPTNLRKKHEFLIRGKHTVRLTAGELNPNVPPGQSFEKFWKGLQ